MAKEQFFIAASQGIIALFDKASNQTGLSRGQVFEDFLTFTRCALAGQTMEEEYLATIAKGYGKGEKGRRGIDTITEAFGRLVVAMDETQQDVLGDIFTGAITYGERGQFFTPDSVCDLMGSLSVPTEKTDEPKTVCDPACGSGRMLLSVAKHQPHWEFTGQDVDHRAAQMTAINLGLNGLRGWAVWQNTLTLECHRVYKIGFNLTGGVIREIPVEQSPFHYLPVPEVGTSTPTIASDDVADPRPASIPTSEPNIEPTPASDPSASQLDLF